MKWPYGKIPTVLAAASCALAATLAYPQSTAPVEHVGVDAERGDPARWHVPADTPQLKYETRVKEAGAAQHEALKDCHALIARRSSCVDGVNEQYRRDVEDARLAMVRSRVG
ncbi:MAG: hypothetical protein WA190_12655 [Usitatibacter sp.]